MCIFLDNNCKNFHHGVHIVCVNESGMVRFIGSSLPPPPLGTLGSRHTGTTLHYLFFVFLFSASVLIPY